MNRHRDAIKAVLNTMRRTGQFVYFGELADALGFHRKSPELWAAFEEVLLEEPHLGAYAVSKGSGLPAEHYWKARRVQNADAQTKFQAWLEDLAEYGMVDAIPYRAVRGLLMALRPVDSPGR